MLGLDFLGLTKKLQVIQLVSSLHGYLPTLLSTTVLDDKKGHVRSSWQFHHFGDKNHITFVFFNYFYQFGCFRAIIDHSKSVFPSIYGLHMLLQTYIGFTKAEHVLFLMRV